MLSCYLIFFILPILEMKNFIRWFARKHLGENKSLKKMSVIRKLLLAVQVVLLVLPIVSGIRPFFNGRRRGGSLGTPKETPNIVANRQKIKDMYCTQKVDNFNRSSGTWKNVNDCHNWIILFWIRCIVFSFRKCFYAEILSKCCVLPERWCNISDVQWWKCGI